MTFTDASVGAVLFVLEAQTCTLPVEMAYAQTPRAASLHPGEEEDGEDSTMRALKFEGGATEEPKKLTMNGEEEE